ncbi:MAG: hypothetical protein JXR71_00495 [Bacteroidales bacterium]|nr:hypothetical protein [Bacteroidales bacterium]
MHDIEPYYRWSSLYSASQDNKSPFFGKQNNEVYFEHVIYNHYIHPQWDDFGSLTLYMKLLFADYDKQYCIIELMGEWNDILYNDVMYLYRNVIEYMMDEGIQYYILIGENVLDFHVDSDDYYAEWFDNLDEGWIVGLNFRDHVLHEFSKGNIDQYISFGGRFNDFGWRSLHPDQLYAAISDQMMKRLT